MRKFIPWIILFFVLLSAVPLLFIYQYIVFAKVVGVVLILLVTIALRIWLRNALKKKLSQDTVKFNFNHRYYLNEVSPIYKNMSGTEKKVLEKRMGKLLADLQFDDTTRQELDIEEMLSYALFQILTVYNDPYKSQKGRMIVFDQTNESGELMLFDEKYALFNPVLLENTLKETRSIDSFNSSNMPLAGQLREFYLKD